MKRISLLVLIALSIFVIYQIQKPILTENNAIIKAKEYVKVINEKMNGDYDTEKKAAYCLLENDSFWNRIIGNRQWSVMIDGLAVNIKATSGEFVEMVFPLDGVINELPK
jgi:lipoprotein signal peptidase